MNLLENELTYRLLIAAIIVAAFYFLSRAVRALLAFMGRKFLSTTQTVVDERILGVILAHVKPLMIVTGLYVGLREIRVGAAADAATLHQILDYADGIIYVAVVLLVLSVVLSAIREIVTWHLDRVSAEGAPALKNTLGPLTSKIVNLLVGLVGVIIILDHFGVNIGSLLVSLGVGSLAVVLAAQDTLANMIAGFVIVVDRPFRVGDRIELATGHVGDVQQIGLRSTRVVDFDNNVIIMPNADLVKGRIVNRSYPDPAMRVVLRFDVAYGTDPGRVRRLLLDHANAQPAILKSPEAQVFVTSMSDAAVQFTLMARCTDHSQQYAVETLLREQIYAAFLRENIPHPARHHVIHTNPES